MRGRFASLSCLMIVGAIALSSTACGLKRTGPISDPADPPSAAPSTTPAATGSAKPSPAPSGKPDVPSGPSGGGGQAQGDLTARVQSIRTTGFMLTRHVIAVVEVANPVDGSLSGQLTCTFGKGSGTDAVQTKQVTLMGHETRTVTFEEKSWFDKDAKVDIKTTHNAVSSSLMPGF